MHLNKLFVLTCKTNLLPYVPKMHISDALARARIGRLKYTASKGYELRSLKKPDTAIKQ